MSGLINLVLLYGGKSGEHEVSLVSAASILSALDVTRYNIIPVSIAKDGCYFLNNYEELLMYKQALPVKTAHSRSLKSLVVDGTFAIAADVVFPIVHGPLYEDGCLQGVLEHAGVAYVGCDVKSSAMGMDKDLARRIVSLIGVRSTSYRVLRGLDALEDIDAFCQQTATQLGWPLFVKPCSLGSSVGIHKVNTISTLKDAINDARRYDEEVLIEAYVEGREIEVAVLEHPHSTRLPKVSIPGEIRSMHPDGFYSYRAKYIEHAQSELLFPAPLNEKVTQQVQQMAGEIFTALKCRGMARVDFFVQEQAETIYFNEINTIPGFTPISMYPKLWDVSGLAYKDLLNELIDLALTRQKQRQQLITHYQ